MGNDLPVVRLTVESMKHSVYVLLQEHEARISSELRAAVESVLGEATLRATLEEEVRRVVKARANWIASNVVAEALKTSDWIQKAVEREVGYALRALGPS